MIMDSTIHISDTLSADQANNLFIASELVNGCAGMVLEAGVLF